jgi:hypothetical protein
LSLHGTGLALFCAGISLSLPWGIAERRAEADETHQARRGLEMSIRKKLYWGFGLILITVFGLFLVNILAVTHEHSAKDTARKAVEMVQSLSKLNQVRMQNRLRLRNFLFSGAAKEVEALNQDEPKMDGRRREVSRPGRSPE